MFVHISIFVFLFFVGHAQVDVLSSVVALRMSWLDSSDSDNIAGADSDGDWIGEVQVVAQGRKRARSKLQPIAIAREAALRKRFHSPPYANVT